MTLKFEVNKKPNDWPVCPHCGEDNEHQLLLQNPNPVTCLYCGERFTIQEIDGKYDCRPEEK